MRKFAFGFLVTVTTVAFAGSATADDDTIPETRITFDDADRVVGDRPTPWGDRLVTRERRGRRSLIRPRVTFVHEILKSVEDL